MSLGGNWHCLRGKKTALCLLGKGLLVVWGMSKNAWVWGSVGIGSLWPYGAWGSHIGPAPMGVSCAFPLVVDYYVGHPNHLPKYGWDLVQGVLKEYKEIKMEGTSKAGIYKWLSSNLFTRMSCSCNSSVSFFRYRALPIIIGYAKRPQFHMNTSYCSWISHSLVSISSGAWLRWSVQWGDAGFGFWPWALRAVTAQLQCCWCSHFSKLLLFEGDKTTGCWNYMV